MRKNVASQSIGCQMITASDGSNFTGTVTVYITIDNGTQTLGTVGSGVCTHEGNGYHSYAPSQAETNGNHIAFTFIGTGAISFTVQVFTISFDPHDTAGLGLSRIDAAITSRMATYTQPTGFLAATFPATVASTTNITAGTITTVTNLTNAPTNGDLTATMKASVNAEVDTALADIGLDHLVQVAVTGTDVTDNSIIARLVSKSATADWDTFVHTTDSLEAIRDRGDAAWVTGAGGDPWATALPGAYGAGSAGYIIGTNLNATVSSRATQTSVDTVDTNVDAILVDTDTTIPGLIAAVQADTDNIQTRIPAALVSGRIDASVGAMAANVVTSAAIAADAIGASELATDAVEEIADQVWNEILSGHLGAGSTGEALNAAGAAGDPWTTTLPGAYGAGSAGYIIGTNINATVGSRATQTSVDTVDTNVDAILVDTDTTIPGLIAAVQADTDNIQTRIPAALVSGRMDSSVGAMAANVLTATAIAADAITAAKIAADAIGASELAADAVAEIQSGLATSAALATVQADTDNIQTRLPAALVGGRMDSNVGSIDSQTSGVASFQRSVASIVRVTVAGGSTATVIQTSSLSPAVVDTDQWKGKVLTFDDQTTTAALRGQAATVTAVDSGTGAITVATGELTRAPAAGDTATLG